MTFLEIFHGAIEPVLCNGRVVSRILLGPDVQKLYEEHKSTFPVVKKFLSPWCVPLEEYFGGHRMGKMDTPGIAVITQKPKLIDLHFPFNPHPWPPIVGLDWNGFPIWPHQEDP